MRTVVNLLLQVVLLGSAYLLIRSDLVLPASLGGLKAYGPVAALAASGLISLSFNRGRAFFALLCLAIVYVSYVALNSEVVAQPVGYIVYAGVAIFVPLNLALFALLPERGVLNGYGLQRLFVFACEAALLYWMINEGITTLPDWLAPPVFDPALLPDLAVPQRALALMLAALCVLIGRAVADGSPVDTAVAGALLGFMLACQHASWPTSFAMFISIGALLLLLGVLQTSYRMAFHDELTGLPSRRSLNERLLGLGRTYTIAMVDVDHFKSFNDLYGHDVGDQVLKMVASELRYVRRGGRAFRYGGEEFALIFPGKSVPQVLRELEAIRNRVGQHRLALRAPDRPLERDVGRKLRGAPSDEHAVFVTVSIGVAEPTERNARPDDVLRAADRALYRAKDKGRNQVSR